jgi:hypothetical protein
MDRGEIYEKETVRRWWEQERGDGDDNIEEKATNDSIKHTLWNSEG